MTVAPILRSAHVRRSPDEVFALFTDRIGAWWPLPTHGLFGAAAGGVSFEDGRLVERSIDGETAVWGEVLEWAPPQRLVIAWHPGRTAGPASRVEIDFHEDGFGTRVEIAHHGWEAFGQDALARRDGYIGPSAWGYVLDHFCDVSDRRPDPSRLRGLRAAYERFFDEAATGGHGEARPGEWRAAQVLAHVAINDDAMSAICRTLIHDPRQTAGQPRFENAVSNSVETLDRSIAAIGDLAALIAVGRARAAQLCTLLDRLDEDQLALPVQCHLRDHDTVVLDEPRPWGTLAIGTQARFHLPLHTDQLRALRPSDRLEGG